MTPDLTSNRRPPLIKPLPNPGLNLGSYLGCRIDFRAPPGEPALVGPDSVAWQVFKNPVTLFIGGISAVILELAEPRVREGVWTHTTFKTEPLKRMRRTGLAAMITVYAARSVAEMVISRIGRMHSRVSGTTPNGAAYHATDPELLDWVQVTANAQFLAAYRTYARPLSLADRDRFFREAGPTAALYGATAAGSEAEALARYEAMYPSLEPSPILDDYLRIVAEAPAIPWPLNGLQAPAIRAAIDLVPPFIRDRINLTSPLTASDRRRLRRAARLAEKIAIPLSPPVEACRRLGLPGDYIHKRQRSRAIPSEQDAS